MPTRRSALAGLAAALAGPSVPRAFAQGAPSLGPDRLVLLGVKGGPSLRAIDQVPSSSLIVWKGVPYVIDCGYGTSMRLVGAGFPLPSLRSVFITHHHSDHNLEATDLPYNAWALGLKASVDVYGPKGVENLIDHGLAAQKFDIETRMGDEGRPDLRKLVRAHAYDEGLVVKTDDVTVTALRNKHPPIVDSFALKFAFAGKTIVFSGDTTYFPPLADFARGADILVHEVAYGPALEALAKRTPNGATLLEHLRASHTLAEDVGRIAKAAGVKTLVLNHFVPGDDKSVTPEVWSAAVRTQYDGPLVISRDLMSIPLS